LKIHLPSELLFSVNALSSRDVTVRSSHNTPHSNGSTQGYG